MSNSLYIAATEARSGKSAIVLGIMQLLLGQIRKVSIFRPIISDSVAGSRDHDIDLILRHFKISQNYEDSYAFTLSQAKRLINEGKQATLVESILNKFKQLEAKSNFILCEGTDYLGTEAAIEFELNTTIANNLGCPMLIVSNGRHKSAQEAIDSSLRTAEAIEERGLDVLGIIVNRTKRELAQQISTELASLLAQKGGNSNPTLVYSIPDEKSLGNPTMYDVMRWVDAQVLYGHGRLDTLVDDYLIAAMHIGNFLDYVEEGSLVITPGDRSDIILASLVSRLSSSYKDISGILLTGGIQPAANVHRLIEGWTGVPLPILSVKEHTYKTTQILNGLHGTIDPENPMKIASALGLFESSVNFEELRTRLISTHSSRVTPLMFEFNLIEKAKVKKQHIVLPEGNSDRILQATEVLLRRDVVDVTLLGNPDEIKSSASRLGLHLDAVRIVDPVNSPHFNDYVQTYFELRKHKCSRIEEARDRLSDPTYFSTMMVYKDHADGMVSGSITTTAQTIRPAFEFIKTKPTASIVSSVFLMCLPDRVLVFGDCAVNPNPTAQQLAEIAINSAHTASVFGVEPRIAMLSYSTGSSGSGEDVQRVIEATALAKEKAPNLLIEGPIQYDAAIDPEVAKTKLPDSKVAGRATVFIFPDLNTGNNTYKAVQRSVAGSVAIGPVLQGLKKPVNDLSRGCRVRDIVNTVAITAIQAQAEKEILEQG